MEEFLRPKGALDLTQFEIRKSASGADIIVPRGEKWIPQPVSTAVSAAAALPPARAGAGDGETSTSSSREPRVYKASELSLEDRFTLCRSVGEECIQVCDTVGNSPPPVGQLHFNV